MSENNKLQCEGCITISSLYHYLYIWLYIYICIPLHTNHDCDELSNDMGDVPCISVTKTRQFYKHTTLKGSRHFSCVWTHQYCIGPTIRWCNAAFLNFPHMHCLLLRKMQVVHRICFAVITAVRGDLGKHQLWLSQTNSNIKQIKHFRTWIPVYKK